MAEEIMGQFKVGASGVPPGPPHPRSLALLGSPDGQEAALQPCLPPGGGRQGERSQNKPDFLIENGPKKKGGTLTGPPL